MNLNVNGVCVVKNGDVYFMNERSKFIEWLGIMGLVLIVFSIGLLILEEYVI